MRTLVESVIADGRVSSSASYTDEYDKLRGAGQELFLVSENPMADLRWLKDVLTQLEGTPRTATLLGDFERAAEARSADLASRPPTMNPTREAIATLLGQVLKDGRISSSASDTDEYDKLRSAVATLLSSSTEPMVDLNWLVAVLSKLHGDAGRSEQMFASFRRAADARVALLDR